MVPVLYKERIGSQSWSERPEECGLGWSSQRLVFTGEDKMVESVLALRGVYPAVIWLSWRSWTLHQEIFEEE